MRNRMLQGICFAIGTLLLPFLLTCLINKNHSDLNLKDISQIQIYDPSDLSSPLDLDTYVTGVVLATIPTNYELETLKAQAVIARTYTLKNLITLKQNSTKVLSIDTLDPKDSGFTTEEIGLPFLSEASFLARQTSKEYQKHLANVNTAVKATKGDIITYKKDLITPLFFLTSAGKTRNSSDLWSVTIPYLISVDSNQDIESSDYTKITIFPVDSILTLLNQAYDNHSLGAADYDYQVYNELPLNRSNIFSSINIINRDSAGYVLTLSLGGILISGESFANVLSLNSSCFYIEEYDQNLRIICNGSGHGIGFSQYGANILAQREGYSYKELLSYYFTNVKVESIR